MVIIIGDWKKKVAQLLVVLVLIAVFAAAIPVMTGKLYQQVPTLGGWFKDEHPSGNPMRVEKKVEKQSKKSEFDQAVDQFVIKLQDFYYEE